MRRKTSIKKKMTEKKIVKIIREYDDGSKEYIDGENLKSFLGNFNIGGACIASNSHFGSFSKVEWTQD